MTDTTLLLLLCLTGILIIIILEVRRPHANPKDSQLLMDQLNHLRTLVSGMTSMQKEDFKINRDEIHQLSRDNRKELQDTLQSMTLQTLDHLRNINKSVEERIARLTDRSEVNHKVNRDELSQNLRDFSGGNQLQLEKINGQVKEDARLMRDALMVAFKEFQINLDKNIRLFNEVQTEKFGQMDLKQNEMVKSTETKLESIRLTVEEKLEKTLSERLGQSFETVGKQLIEVQKGLGEMQTLASDVGGLKKVLSNVKLRGGVGEVQLAMLLEQMLAPNQYEANVRTKKGSNDPVEFAIKLPGRNEEENQFVYLPVDAKFPKETYEQLIVAYENALPAEIETATKLLENTIRKMAKDIRDKYIDPPHTTDFAILFLPFESIYAEVIRRSSLVDVLRNEYKITVAGPTTLMAILNSLQMGFRTLSLQKRSSEVWKVLASVQKEFESFGGLLDKAQKNIQTGLGQLDDVVGVRTRAIQRQLKKVEQLPGGEGEKILISPEEEAKEAQEME